MESASPVRNPDDLKARKVDTVSASLIYVGLAAPGAAASSAVWQIKKISITGAVLEISWADGNAEYANVWNDRAGLSYV